MENLQQNQRVKFSFGSIEGCGKIVGKAIMTLPVIGGTYIIEPDTQLEEYDYSHFVLSETHFKLI